MIAARALLLLLAAGLACAVIGAPLHELQSSAARVLVTAVVAVLAPLLWPGCAATAAGTIVRAIAWSAIAAALAALLLLLPGSAPQPPLRVAVACTLLLLLLLPLHAAAASVEAMGLRLLRDRAAAQALAGTVVALALVLWASVPVWAGPAAALASMPGDTLIDGVVAASPLTHLAVAGGNDLLRNEWFYQHANLAALPVSYPELTPIAAIHAVAAPAALALAFVALRRISAADHRSSKEPSR